MISLYTYEILRFVKSNLSLNDCILCIFLATIIMCENLEIGEESHLLKPCCFLTKSNWQRKLNDFQLSCSYALIKNPKINLNATVYIIQLSKIPSSDDDMFVVFVFETRN